MDVTSSRETRQIKKYVRQSWQSHSETTPFRFGTVLGDVLDLEELKDMTVAEFCYFCIHRAKVKQ